MSDKKIHLLDETVPASLELYERLFGLLPSPPVSGAGLRKVLVYKWEKVTKPPQDRIEHVKVLRGEGLFHQFGHDFQKFKNGACEFTTAIVEMPDGSIKNIQVELVVFNDVKQGESDAND